MARRSGGGEAWRGQLQASCGSLEGQLGKFGVAVQGGSAIVSIRIRRWTGREAMCLKEALRMTNLELAERLGMSPTSVKNWRRGGENLACKTSTSQLLDRMVDRLSPVEEEAFRGLLIEHGAEFELVDLPPTLVGEFSLTSHQFIPSTLDPPQTPCAPPQRPARLARPASIVGCCGWQPTEAETGPCTSTTSTSPSYTYGSLSAWTRSLTWRFGDIPPTSLIVPGRSRWYPSW